MKIKKTKNEIINELVTYWAEAIEYDELIAFYCENQRKCLEKMNKTELIESYKQNILNNED